MTTDEENAEKPLDPAAERLRRKLVRLLVFSMGFMILSVMTVFGVILYKTLGEEPPIYDGQPIVVDIPHNATIESSSITEDHLLLSLDDAGETRLIVLSIETGEVVREFVSKRTATPDAD